jgi:hypothetical protein
MTRIRSALALLLLAIPAMAHAQAVEHPTRVPSYRGTPANAPIPPAMHWRNEGGSDGAGLCVISSLKINGNYQGVPDLDELWRVAKSRPGGYSPTKLEDLLAQVMPDEKWASYVGTDPTVLHRLSGMGYPIGSTMNTGELYNYGRIHHMISLVHFDRERDLACVVDNNQPGIYSWMTTREYLSRWVDGGTGWAFVWLRKLPADFESLAVLLLAGGAIAAICIARRPKPVPAPAMLPVAPAGLFDDWGNPSDW